jgi:translation initiation factor 4G
MVIQPSSLEPEANGRTTKVRSILGSTVGKKYNIANRIKAPTPTNYGSIPLAPPMAVVATPGTMTAMTPLSSETSLSQQQQDHQEHAEEWQSPPTTAQHNRGTSRMTPRILPTKQYSDYGDYYDDIVDDRGSVDDGDCNGVCASGGGDPELKDLLRKKSSRHRRPDFRKSVHAQSLLVGLAFMVVWLPNNAMAPNLTQMAHSYGMDDAERDLYLGSYCALALGVFCLPLSGLIGFMADFYSRKYLFLACCVLGALSSACSGWAQDFWQLFLARLFSGGIMSGSVPVAFSLLGDLFSKEERNAASSGLTSMMGLGIIIGQVYAGEVGPSKSWQYPFYMSALAQLAMGLVIALLVEEPVRGGKEKALQGVFESGKQYDKQLTLQGFYDTMRKNESNWILLWYGFVTSLPWGIVFVFLNDFLSQEKGFSVEEATYLVMIFGVGCAFGGIIGGYLGQLFVRLNRSFIPLYMSAATFLGIFPFLALLNSEFPNHTGFRSKFYCVTGGLIATLPSVNVRPCIINVNPPESRGAALTATNLFVTLGRGMGPTFIVLLGSIFDASRKSSFNITLLVFWTFSAVQLLFLANALPRDQDAMEEELVRYAAAAQASKGNDGVADEEEQAGGADNRSMSPVQINRESFLSDALQPRTPERLVRGDDADEIFHTSVINSPPSQYIMAIDGKSARESLELLKLGLQEFGDEFTLRNAHCRGCDTISPSDSLDDIRPQPNGEEGGDITNRSNSDDGTPIVPMDGEVLFSREEISEAEMERRRDMWKRRQKQQQTK